MEFFLCYLFLFVVGKNVYRARIEVLSGWISIAEFFHLQLIVVSS